MSKKHTRNRLMMVRFTESELAEIKRRSKGANMPSAEVVRLAVRDLFDRISRSGELIDIKAGQMKAEAACE